MKTNTATRIDKISVRVIQFEGITILESLHHIFHLCIRTGILPDDWKIARATPIYKSDDDAEYSKIFKKLCNNQLLFFLMKTKL